MFVSKLYELKIRNPRDRIVINRSRERERTSQKNTSLSTGLLGHTELSTISGSPMRSLTDNKTAAALFAGVTLVGALSACSSPATGTDASVTEGATPATNGDYADGTYTETGDYTSPNGAEQVEVTLTLASNVITDVTVVGFGESPNSKQFQGEFIGGIADEVVGKNIDELSVDKVAGSSLTSGGFNNAVEAIKADALAE